MSLFHFWFAHLFGYFWAKCPECGKMFGGHQSRGVRWQEPTEIGGTRTGEITCCLKADIYRIGFKAGEK